MINQEQRPITVNACMRIESKGCRSLAIAAIIAALAFLLMFAYWHIGRVILPARAIPAQASPPPSEGGSQQGQAQESRVREMLRKEGYEQPLGESDTAIRQNLGLKANESKVADFVGHNPANDRWLVAESKGGNMESAMGQLRNTARNLWQRNSSATPGNTDFRIYTSSEQYQKLQLSSQINKMGGYELREGYLGYYNEVGTWIDEVIEGAKVLVMIAP